MKNFFKRLFNNVNTVKKSCEVDILQKENVCGVGVQGEKIIVLVQKKVPLEDLKVKDVVPSNINGFNTDVIEVGEITPSSVSACPRGGTACSLGAICYKNGESYYLQNSHCKFDSVGEMFLMPSPSDGGKQKHKVGIVSEQTKISAEKNNRVDALIAKTDKPLESSLEVDTAKVNDYVWFEGRTSGVQRLKVVADNVTIGINYGAYIAVFENQIMLEGIVRGGDSGSGLKKADAICGLIFASNNINYGFAHHISDVQKELGITFKKEIVSEKPTYSENFKKAVEVVLKHEGGYVNDFKDPGGETKYGISKRAYPNLDIKNLTIEQAKEIYYKDYWLKTKCDQMEYGIALQVFDTAVNTGIKNASILLQKILKVSTDGIIGNITLNTLKSYSGDILIEYSRDRMKYYQGLSIFPTYKNGWTNRVFDTLKESMR